MKQIKIAEMFETNRATIFKIINNCLKCGTVDSAFKLGRPKEIIARIDNIIKIKVKRDPKRIAVDINALRTENLSLNVPEMLISC